MAWKTTKLIVIGSLVTLDFCISLAATLITVSTGIPLMSGAITAFVGPILMITCGLIVNQFGTFTIYELLYTFLALPTALWGPPGFLPKVLVGLAIGVLSDVVYFLFKKLNKFISFTIISLIANFLGTLLFVIFGKFMNVPGVEKTAIFIIKPIFILAFLLVAILDSFLAIKISEKLKTTSVVRRIQGN
jgi:hypothetical protein